jgi:alpha 1,2-mannosyltransferase
MKNCITYLLRSSKEDIEMLNKSLFLLEKNLLHRTKNYDVIIFYEKDLGNLKDDINTNLNLLFYEVVLTPPIYENEISERIPEFYPHPTHGNGPIAYGHPGFTIGYRNMCRFFSGKFHELEILSNYEYYLRLDTDSYILSELNYDIFEFAKQNDLIYGYCEPAVQIDNPKVVEGLKEFTKNFLMLNELKTYISIDSIPEGKMFYTNFELGKVNWFLNSDYIKFFKSIDNSGNIYIKRWGDAPIKYLGVNLFCNPKNIIPVKGFTYQHGAVYYL